MKAELILSTVLAASTVFYTFINLMMLLESRKTRMQKIAPLMIAFLKGSENHQILCVCFQNVGEGCAKDVHIKVLKDYKQFGKHPLSNVMLLKNGSNIFPPQHKMVYFINTFANIKETNDYVEFEISYTDVKGNKFKDIYKLPFNQVGSNFSTPPETYMGQIPYYLKNIEASIKKLSCQHEESVNL